MAIGSPCRPTLHAVCVSRDANAFVDTLTVIAWLGYADESHTEDSSWLPKSLCVKQMPSQSTAVFVDLRMCMADAAKHSLASAWHRCTHAQLPVAEVENGHWKPQPAGPARSVCIK